MSYYTPAFKGLCGLELLLKQTSRLDLWTEGLSVMYDWDAHADRNLNEALNRALSPEPLGQSAFKSVLQDPDNEFYYRTAVSWSSDDLFYGLAYVEFEYLHYDINTDWQWLGFLQTLKREMFLPLAIASNCFTNALEDQLEDQLGDLRPDSKHHLQFDGEIGGFGNNMHRDIFFKTEWRL